MSFIKNGLSINANNASSVDVKSAVDSVIRKILLDRFPGQPARHEISPMSNRYNFNCPYCGDSVHDPYKKRGNVYYGSYWYKCYNGGCGVSKPFIQVVKDYNMGDMLSVDHVDSLYNNSYVGTSDASSTDMSGVSLIDVMNTGKYSIPFGMVKRIFSLKDPRRYSSVMRYIEGRNQLDYIDNFMYQPSNKRLCIMNRSNTGNIMGVQFRSIVKKSFQTYKYTQIVCDELKIDVDPKIASMMDKISIIYNISRVDFSKPVIILESAFDSNHIKNSISTFGIDDRINLPFGYFMFDNSNVDTSGRYMATKSIKTKKNTFLWSKFLVDFPQYSECKDVDDMVSGGFVYSWDLIKNYFSNDPLDILDI